MARELMTACPSADRLVLRRASGSALTSRSGPVRGSASTWAFGWLVHVGGNPFAVRLSAWKPVILSETQWSEESPVVQGEILRSAQNDKLPKDLRGDVLVRHGVNGCLV